MLQPNYNRDTSQTARFFYNLASIPELPRRGLLREHWTCAQRWRDVLL